MNKGIFFPVIGVYRNLPSGFYVQKGILYPDAYLAIPSRPSPELPLPPRLLMADINQKPYKDAWAFLSNVYMSSPSLEYEFPLNSELSYFQLLNWAENNGGQMSEYHTQYKTMQELLAYLPPPPTLATQIKNNSQFAQAWDELSHVYFSLPTSKALFLWS